ncbi:MAG: hypothetical protein U9O78_01465 [Patescibacteria group bacterium]|nr:hypothetical protein [Patescibacteria group bacterium]
MKRRTKKDLKLAKKRRQRKAKKLIEQEKGLLNRKTEKIVSDGKLISNTMGYGLSLVKKDLIKTTWVSLLVSLILIVLALII